jgi:hypothetical protein
MSLFWVAAIEVDTSAQFNTRIAAATGSIPTDSDYYDSAVIATKRPVVFEVHAPLFVDKSYFGATNWLRHHSL